MKKIFFTLMACAISISAFSQYSTLSVSQDPGSDATPALTPIYLSNRGLNGGTYGWALYTAAVGGGFGVRPNAFEIWEYPPTGVNTNCCMQRLVIDHAPTNTSASAVILDSKGGLAIGGYTDAGSNYLSVNGNVGIGTQDTQGYKLAVNGNAIAESVTVKLHTNWPDYVFKPTYNLRPLAEVKSFITKNQRLPEMPSEQDVAKNGINLGEIVKLQTKKIEELTLYLIQKDKEISDLKQTQQKQIDELRKQVETLLKKKP